MIDIDWTQIFVAACAALPPTLVALGAFVTGRGNRKKLATLHVELNSRLSQLIASRAPDAPPK